MSKSAAGGRHAAMASGGNSLLQPGRVLRVAAAIKPPPLIRRNSLLFTGLSPEGVDMKQLCLIQKDCTIA
jgi:hypothetical protein